MQGSHHIYRHPDGAERLNLQSRGGNAKTAPTAPGGHEVSDYHINVFWSAEDDAWVADIPDLQYCSAFGDTPQEALAEVLQAKDAWLESAHAHGDPVPPPRYRPAIYAAS